MNSYQGFWSYVHEDDKAEQGRISKLANDVVAQYEMLTGETIELFLDKDAINWGENWRGKVDNSLESVAFFIPIMTPRYFLSPECRRELQFFARRADQLGIKELVLPLYYVDVQSLSDDTDQDDLINLVKKFQWEDWRELRFADVTTEAYRRGVSGLANRLVTANKHAEELSITKAERSLEDNEAGLEKKDETPGFIDLLATLETTLPEWTETINSISHEIQIIGAHIQNSTAEIQKGSKAGKGFAHRLAISRQLAKKLEDPVTTFSKLVNNYTSQLYKVDGGIRIIIEKGAAEIEQSPESKEDLCQFFETIKVLSSSSQETHNSIQSMHDGVVTIEKMSRDLRPILRRLRKGLMIMIEAKEVIESWVELIDSSGIDCQNPED